MPKVGEKEFPYTPEGIQAAAEESSESGMPIQNAGERSTTTYAGGGKTGYSVPEYRTGGRISGGGKVDRKAKRQERRKERKQKREIKKQYKTTVSRKAAKSEEAQKHYGTEGDVRATKKAIKKYKKARRERMLGYVGKESAIIGTGDKKITTSKSKYKK